MCHFLPRGSFRTAPRSRLRWLADGNHGRGRVGARLLCDEPNDGVVFGSISISTRGSELNRIQRFRAGGGRCQESTLPDAGTGAGRVSAPQGSIRVFNRNPLEKKSAVCFRTARPFCLSRAGDAAPRFHLRIQSVGRAE
jgi:hypothetical protein